MSIKIVARKAMLAPRAPISMKLGATGIGRCEEPESAGGYGVMGAGERDGGGSTQVAPQDLLD